MPQYEVVMNNPYAHSTCLECGASIDNEAKHTEFHAKFDELIEWAQAVSKSIVEWPEATNPNPCDCVNAPEGSPDCKYCTYTGGIDESPKS